MNSWLNSIGPRPEASSIVDMILERVVFHIIRRTHRIDLMNPLPAPRPWQLSSSFLGCVCCTLCFHPSPLKFTEIFLFFKKGGWHFPYFILFYFRRSLFSLSLICITDVKFREINFLLFEKPLVLLRDFHESLKKLSIPSSNASSLWQNDERKPVNQSYTTLLPFSHFARRNFRPTWWLQKNKKRKIVTF